MYSLLLMTAMAGAPEASGFGWRTAGCYGGGCYGSSCYGSSCYGSCSGSCYGSAWGSCSGSCTGYTSCSGSTGSGRSFLGILDCLRGRRSSCHGSCSGSYASCYGSSCHGSSCFGSSCYGSACWGSCYGSSYQLGCTGFGSCYGSGLGCTGFGCGGGVVVGAPVVTGAPATGAPTTGTPMTGGSTSGTSTSTSNYTPADGTPTSAETKAPARLTIELPASAKLYVDGSLVAGNGASREFHTPDLPAGQSFFYDLKAEVEVNGKAQTEETRVIVRAGDKVTASFPKLVAAIGGAKEVAAAK